MFSKLKNIIGICAVAFLLLVFPVIFGKSTIHGLVTWQNAKSWASTEGTIVASRRTFSSRGMSHADILYKYSVHSQYYLSKSFDVPDPRDPFRSTGHHFDMYPVESKTTVFYDESQPADSLLDREFTGEIWVSFACFLMTSGFSLTVVYLFLTTEKRRAKKALSWKMKRYEKRQKQRVLKALREKSSHAT